VYEIGGKVRGITILDPVRGKTSLLDARGKTVSESRLELRDVGHGEDLVPPPGAELRNIGGITCFRVRVQLPNTQGEAWISSALHYSVEERIYDAGYWFGWKLFDVVIGDPDPKLFDIP
jgi:hypothetical protein